MLLAHFLGAPAPRRVPRRVSRGRSSRSGRSACSATCRSARASERRSSWSSRTSTGSTPSSEEFLQSPAARAAVTACCLLLSTRPGFGAVAGAAGGRDIALEGLDRRRCRRDDPRLWRRRRGLEAPARAARRQGRGQSPLRRGDPPAAPGDRRASSSRMARRASARRRRGARDDPRHHRRARRPSGGVAEADAAGGRRSIGRRFGVSLLSRVLESRPASRGGRPAASCTRLDFIFPSAHDPELVYSFKHALTQDVVYASLLERRRRQYHAARRARRSRSSMPGRLDEVVELLAYHFGRSAEDEKAVDYAILAAEKAQRRWANTEALAQFEPRSAPRAHAGHRGQPPPAHRRGDQAGRDQVRAGPPRRARPGARGHPRPGRRGRRSAPAGRLVLLERASSTASPGGRPEVPIAYCREAVAIAEASGLDDDPGRSPSAALAHVYRRPATSAARSRPGERALAAFEARGNVWWACRALWALSPAANDVGEWERGLEYCRRALEPRTVGRTTCASRWSAGGARAPPTSSAATRSPASAAARTRSRYPLPPSTLP